MLFYGILKKLKYLPLVLAVALSGYFAWHGYYGQRGYVKWQEMKAEYAATVSLNEHIKKEKEKLGLKVQNMYSGNIDADLLDEMARKVLNFAAKDEIIIFD